MNKQTTTIPATPLLARNLLAASTRAKRADIALRRADLCAAKIAASIRSEIEAGHHITQAHAAELSAMLQAVAK